MSATAGLTDRLTERRGAVHVRVKSQRGIVWTSIEHFLPPGQRGCRIVGVGDVALRAKYNVWRRRQWRRHRGRSQVADGRQENLLGAGSTIVTPRVIAHMSGALGLHGSFGAAFGGSVRRARLRGALTISATSRLTRWVNSRPSHTTRADAD
jgi:hypothetical protein